MSLKDTITKLLNSNDTVFITGHNNPDFDALGASIGIAFICEKFKKKCYIVLDEDYQEMDKSTAIVVEDMKNRFNVIKSDEVKIFKGEENLLIVLDTNKEYRIHTNTSDFDDILIIDHHETDEKTIKNSYKYIDPNASSTCEIVEGLMNQLRVKFNPKYFANYLYAGIKLDTKSFDKATEYSLESAARLIKSGADTTFVNNLFAEDFEKDRLIQKLVQETKMFDFSIAIACQNPNLDVYYAREDLAKAADYLLKFNVNASFAIGKLDEQNYYISARSKGLIDVGNVMSRFSEGGGNLRSAAAKVPMTMSLDELESLLMHYLTPGYIHKEEDTKVKRLTL